MVDISEQGSLIDRATDYVSTAAIDLTKTVITYFAALSGGLFLTLTACSAAGYLPYSDRPGPGWYGPAHVPVLGEINYYLSFCTTFLGVYSAIAGALIFVIARLLGCLRMPRWAVAVYEAVTVALISLVIVAAAGWYIAIASFPVLIAALVGLLYGAVVMPKFARSGSQNPSWWQWVLSPVAPGLVWCYLLRPWG